MISLYINLYIYTMNIYIHNMTMTIFHSYVTKYQKVYYSRNHTCKTCKGTHGVADHLLNGKWSRDSWFLAQSLFLIRMLPRIYSKYVCGHVWCSDMLQFAAKHHSGTTLSRRVTSTDMDEIVAFCGKSTCLLGLPHRFVCWQEIIST